jgi:hypothetical protein
LIQCKEHVVLHKRYFSKQSKRLRKFQEIAHGQTFFYGFVNCLATILSQSALVASEDDEFWDKYFLFMRSIYYLRLRGLKESHVNIPDQDVLDLVVENMYNVIVVLPEGDIITIGDRTNPSGADATTENNCLGRCLVEAYMQILHYQNIDKPLLERSITRHKHGTKYLGDDRIAGSADYVPGYFTFYKDNVSKCGVKLKTLIETNGPEGSEFAGFTLRRSHWNSNFFVPHYKLDKLYAGLFTNVTHDAGILLSRFMAFAILMYPQIEQYRRYAPIVTGFLQSRYKAHDLFTVTVSFWNDERFCMNLWTGYESEYAHSNILEYIDSFKVEAGIL